MTTEARNISPAVSADLPKRIGKYEVVRLVGKGGMGRVYEAMDPDIGRRVAVKVLVPPPSVDEARRARMLDFFRREAKAAGNLSHPNIVTIYEVGEDTGTNFIAMEFLKGTTLKQEVTIGGPMGPQRVAEVGAQLAAALDYAHRHGVYHRDIKPENVIITTAGVPKLTDFGIARVGDAEGTSEEGRTVFGSPGYMSPEQMRGEPIDQRSDLYSLGLTLLEMLRGEKVFKAKTRDEALQRALKEQPEPPDWLPAEMAKAIRKCLAPDREARHENAGQLAEELRVASELMAAEREGLIPRHPDARRKMRALEKATCAYHPAAPAVDLCGRCGKAVCVSCLRVSGGEPRCVQCVPRTRLSPVGAEPPPWPIIVFIAVSLVSVFVLLFFLLR